MLEVLFLAGLLLTSSTAIDPLVGAAWARTEAELVAGDAHWQGADSDDDEAVESAHWSWAVTVGAGLGGLPGGVILGSGVLLGGLAVGILVSFAVGSGLPLLAYIARYSLFMSLPIFTAGISLIPPGVLVGSLIGGAFDGRFPWSAASGSLIGVIPAIAACAVAVISFQILSSVFGLQAPAFQAFILQGSALAVLAGLLGISVGPIAVLGGVTCEWLAWRFLRTDSATSVDLPGGSE